MCEVTNIYKDVKFEGWDMPSGYQPMIDALGKVAIQVDDNDYSGDTRVLYHDGSKFGILIFGWGSCSGCDALQCCSSVEDVQDLFEDLKNRTKWLDSKQDCLDYFNEHDWQGDYCWHQEETHEFINKSKEYLSSL